MRRKVHAKTATPGPWRAAPVESWQEYGMVEVYGKRAGRWRHVANVWNGGTRDPDVAAANARLIAAAPDLLDALQRCALALESADNDPEGAYENAMKVLRRIT